MDKKRINLIIKKLESLVEDLKTEIDSDSPVYHTNTSVDTKLFPGFEDYDEIFDDNCPD
jgi:hypothetical protein